ncbi:DUF4407 domain-containing protein [Mycolicibacterium mageritense]|uniref:DUF4407 domain-containing protein n=1 Tax=Mycolicibacterium mageritense TaxID=53462 RepID=A0AAI8XP69_MYCME|nr:DUF4407 domain-containing protein [Mycolicibacterium mageritense]BDY29711.1 hypothetical protein hbim_03651 [Mycolicibacterium mageritense]
MRAGRKPEPLVVAVLLLGGVLAAAAAILALSGATRWPPVAVVAAGVVFGALFAVASWAVAGGRSAVAGRVAVAVVVGVTAGELAAVSVFGGSVDQVLTEQASTAPAVVAATAELDAARQARTGLDDAVAQANRHRDEALVVARCEFNPSADCPRVRITGVPGAGPETRTANEFLGDAQRQLDTAVAERDSRAAALDAQIAAHEQAVAQARAAALDGGLGARWVAMNSYTLGHPGALALRLLVVGFFVLLSGLPLALRRWRGATTPERADDAQAEQERAELEADTAIAVKRAEVRATIEEMWAEQELTSARLAVEAQNEIDREQQRRRVAEALDAPVEPVRLQRPEPVMSARPEPIEAAVLPEPDVYLPIAAEAEAASLALTAAERDNLPVKAEPQRGTGIPGLPAIPTIPDVTKAVTKAVTNGPVRWIKPFVPPIVAGAIDNATKPLRQVFVETETEEIHVTVKRTHKVTVESEGSAEAAPQQPSEPAPVPSGRVQSWRGPALTDDVAEELRRADGPRQLLSGE